MSSPSNAAISRIAASTSAGASARELVDARVQQEALEPEHAGLVQRPQVGEVAGHGAAPEPHVHPRLAVGRLALDLQRRDVDGRRDAVERHVDDGRDPAGGGGLGRGLEPLPLGAPRVVDVDVRVDDARAAAPRRRPARRRLPRARRGRTPAPRRDDAPVLDRDVGAALAVGQDRPPGSHQQVVLAHGVAPVSAPSVVRSRSRASRSPSCSSSVAASSKHRCGSGSMSVSA